MPYTVDSGTGDGIFCFFEDDGETGYLYLYEPYGAGILDHLHIYSNPQKLGLGIKESDIDVVWSSDGSKCGVKLWGKFYGIFDLATNQKMSVSVDSRHTPPIQDPTLLRGF